jgi:hypothetical protein
MMTPNEISGVDSYPPLPGGLKFTKRGYVKNYDAPAEQVFEKALAVVNGTGSFVGYELLGKTSLKGLSRPFVKSTKHPVLRRSTGWESGDPTFEVEVEVSSEPTAASPISELALRFYHPPGTEKPPGSFSDLTGTKAIRTFYHLHAITFISKMDSTTDSSPTANHEISANNHKANFHHESMRRNYLFSTRRRRLLIFLSIAMSAFLILLRYLV